MYFNGEGVPENNVQAYKWWNLAAAQGDESAKKNKGTIEKKMTREQIAEAQRLSAEWKPVVSEVPEEVPEAPADASWLSRLKSYFD